MPRYSSAFLYLTALGFACTASAQAPTIGGSCTVFPADNIWNTPVDQLPLAANSSTYVNTIGASYRMNDRYTFRLIIDNIGDEKNYISVAGGRSGGRMAAICAVPAPQCCTEMLLSLTFSIKWSGIPLMIDEMREAQSETTTSLINTRRN